MCKILVKKLLYVYLFTHISVLSEMNYKLLEINYALYTDFADIWNMHNTSIL